MEERRLIENSRKPPVKLAFQGQPAARGLGAGSIDQQSTERMAYEGQSSNLRSINGSPAGDKLHDAPVMMGTPDYTSKLENIGGNTPKPNNTNPYIN